MNNSKKIYGLMVLAALFWSAAFIAGKLAVPYIPTFTLTFLRFLIATRILLFLVQYRERKGETYHVDKKHIPVFLFTGIVGMFGYHVFFFISLRYTTAINSSIIGAMNPIITTIIAAVFLAVKIPVKQVVGILISFVGVMLTISGGNLQILSQFDFNKGDLWMLAATTCWAAYGVFSKSQGKKVPPLYLTYYSFLVCTLFLIPFVIWEKPWKFLTEIPLSAWAAVLYMSVFASVGGYLIQQISIKKIGPSRTSIFINLVPVFSMVFAVLMLGETLEPVKILTAAFIILGVCICQLSESTTQEG